MDALVKQLNLLLEKYAEFKSKAVNNDLSDLSKVERQSLITRAIAAVNRISGPKSTYSKEVERIILANPPLHLHTSSILGIVQALKEDLENGYIRTLVELVHADVFASFLDMAFHLNESGYKDAAAVLVGSTLESHLKELCIKHAIPVENNGRPEKSDRLNSELARADVYSKLDQKNVTAWLDLRNKAAHGDYDKYTSEQVELFTSAVSDFIGRVPA